MQRRETPLWRSLTCGCVVCFDQERCRASQSRRTIPPHGADHISFAIILVLVHPPLPRPRIEEEDDEDASVRYSENGMNSVLRAQKKTLASVQESSKSVATGELNEGEISAARPFDRLANLEGLQSREMLPSLYGAVIPRWPPSSRSSSAPICPQTFWRSTSPLRGAARLSLSLA